MRTSIPLDPVDMRRVTRALLIGLAAGLLFVTACGGGGSAGAPDSGADTHDGATGTDVAADGTTDGVADVAVDVAAPDLGGDAADDAGRDAVADVPPQPFAITSSGPLVEVCGDRVADETTVPWQHDSATEPVLGTLRDMRAGDLLAVHLTTPHPLQLRRLSYYIALSGEAPGQVELRLFRDLGRSQPDTPPDTEGTDLVAPVVREVTETGWVTWELDPPLILRPDEHFWPGVRLLADDGPQVAVGTATTNGRSLVRSQAQIEEMLAQGEQFFKWVGLGDGAEFMVRAEGVHFCALAERNFTLVTEAAGLAASGGRMVWGDIDGDDWPDLLSVNAPDADGQQTQRSRLFRNRGDGTFEDVTERSQVAAVTMSLALFLDANGDGFPDIFFADYLAGDPPFPEDKGSGLLLNDGTGVFTLKADSGLFTQGPVGAAAAADADGDGHIDLFVGHWLTHYPQGPFPNAFFKGNGDGTFVDVSDVMFGDAPAAPCYGAIWGDFDDDGDQDLFVANYGGAGDELWLNDGAGGFTDVAWERRVSSDRQGQSAGTCFGVALDDYDNDGHLDLYTAAITHPRYLWIGSDYSMLRRNEGPPDYRFRDVTTEAGFVYQEGQIEPSFGDFDNDGDLDLFVSSTYPLQFSRLWRQTPAHTFEDTTYQAGFVVEGSGNNTWVDFDRDGKLDLLAIVSGWRHHLYRNDLDLAGAHFIAVRLFGTAPGVTRDAIGARLTVRGTTGPARIREVRCGEGHYNSQPPLDLHVGLGPDAGPVTLEVRWPNGQVETFPDVAVDRFYRLTQGSTLTETARRP